MRHLIWLLQIVFLSAMILLIALIPLKIALRIGDIIGLGLFYLLKKRRNIAIDNIKESIKAGAIDNSLDPTETIKQNFKNFIQSIVEMSKIYMGLGDKILENISVKGLENYHRANAKGKGVLFITGHCGNWDLMAIAASLKIAPSSIVARAHENPYLNRSIERIRNKYGNRLIYKQGALKSMIRSLRKGDSVGILMDQCVIPSEGVLIDFLGRRAWTMKIPVILAQKTGAAIIPAFIRRTASGHEIELHPQVVLNQEKDNPIETNTKLLSSYIENYIIDNPTEWLWVHRRWKRND